MLLRPEIEALPNSPIVEVANYGRGRPGLIPLWFGEGDVPAPSFVADACDRAVREGHVFYTWQRGLPELRAALSAYLGRVHGVPVEVDRITVTTSGMHGIVLAMQALVGPGDEVAVVAPVWPNVFAAVRIVGGVPVQVPLSTGDGGWTLDLERLFAACGPRTRAIFVNSPGNPTGWTMGRDDLGRLLAFARERGIWVISDEVYSRVSYTGRPAPSMLELAAPDDRMIVLNSFSKTWAMTGWRLGWLAAPAEMGPHFEKLVQFSTSGVPGFVQMAGFAAIEQGEPFVAEMVERCRRGRDIVCDALERLPRLRLSRPDAAFYAFFSVEGETDSVSLAKRLIDETGVGLAPGAAFGDAGEGYLRLCFASSPEKLEEAVARLAPALR
ncbi:pyridoxal phosphate-dependent aminotransferase [Arenibaculum pallidiluteum]|uniref:pyridoxal phosphate-dependent aminotransferase n=1 Tax=Arenibaculum pallidiluteum TaxID=2812559 RepID=UPI001A957B25|nr:pyridoxal phosphate-dependent aminotransferase [Arenibaculum pallidiluteum]